MSYFHPILLKRLNEVAGILPRANGTKDRGRGTTLFVIEDTAIQPFGMQKVDPRTMTFTLIPPSLGSETVPNNGDRFKAGGTFIQINRFKVDINGVTTPDDRATLSSSWFTDEKARNFYLYDKGGAANGAIQYQTSLQELRQDSGDVTTLYNNIRDIPPLVMLINPSNMSFDFSKMTSDGNYTRSGYVVEPWGENQDTVQCDGKIGGFYAMHMTKDPGFFDSAGLTRSLKIGSLSYQNLMALVALYRSNGCVYRDIDDPRRPTAVGAIMMTYNGVAYVGNFDEFSISEKDENAYNLEYSFSFTISSTLDTMSI